MNTQPLRIIIVEDEEAHSEAIKRALDKSGLTESIRTDRTLSEFRKELASGLPHIVLMDLNLPDGQAFELLTAPPEKGPFPMLIMTSFGDEQTAVRALKSGAMDYIVKSPEAFADIPHIIQRTLREWDLLIGKKTAEEKIRRMNFLLYHIRSINRLTVSEKSPLLLIQKACNQLISEGMYTAAMIMLFKEDGTPRMTAQAGTEPEFQLLADDQQQGRLPTCCAPIRSVNPAHPSSGLTSVCTPCSLPLSIRRRMICIRLQHEAKFFGFMTITLPTAQEFGFEKEEKELFVEIANDLSLALHGIESINQTKNAERALRESEERFRTLTENAPIGIYLTDPAGNYTYTNKKWQQISGLTVQEALGDGWVKGLPADEKQEIESSWMEAIQNRTEWEREHRFRDRDGRDIWLLAAVAPIRILSNLVSGYVGTIVDITERKRAEETTRTMLREKEVMLREINHRVKNNMQVISSLLSLQMGENTHPSVKSVFIEAQMRIQSMALIHESLYRSEDLSRINFAEYIQELVTHLREAYPIKPDRIEFDTHLENVYLDINIGVPCGLLINELVSNALKYAFPQDRKGIIRIRLTCRHKNRVSLSISDNGIGFPQQIDPLRLDSTGMQIITTLTEQIDGKIRFDRSRGSRFTIEFTL